MKKNEIILKICEVTEEIEKYFSKYKKFNCISRSRYNIILDMFLDTARNSRKIKKIIFLIKLEYFEEILKEIEEEVQEEERG